MSKPSIIRSLYFYIISIIGLMMIVFSTADLINLGLKTWVFPKADRYYSSCDNMLYPSSYGTAVSPKDAGDRQKEQCEQQLKRDKENAVSNKQSQAVRDLSFLVVGLPLFAFHFRIAQKERREEKELHA